MITARKTYKNGFTLVETFVAMTILLVAIVAPMTTAQRGLQSAFFSNERITATYLAKEGIEAMRAYRDAHMLDGNDWIADSAAADFEACEEDSGCGFNMNDISGLDDAFVDCDESIDACLLYYTENPGNGDFMYHHESANGDESQYTRVIRIEEIQDGKEAVVEVTVSWYSGLFRENRSVVLTDHLLNYDL